MAIFPRTRKQQARYGRHKVVAAGITFALVWFGLKWLAPDARDALEGLGTVKPGDAFRERTSGETVQARVVVEAVLLHCQPDT